MAEQPTRTPHCWLTGAGITRGGPGSFQHEPPRRTGWWDSPKRTVSHASSCTKSVTEVGLPGFHFHDPRHTGNTLTSRTGASLADVTTRMGHSPTRAAVIYQHAAPEQDQAIAAHAQCPHRQGARSGT